jgi:hypothetical protein
MTLRGNLGESLPELVTVSREAVLAEAGALRDAMAEFSSEPQPGCPAELDAATWSDRALPGAEGRMRLSVLTRHLAMLVYANAFDHLHTLGRSLGSDGAMPVFSHTTTSRVVCEAAVRFAWQLDPGVSSGERLVRGAVALLDSEEQRLKGAMRLPEQFGLRQTLVDQSVQERDRARQLIARAGVRLVPARKGDVIARLELDSPTGVSVSVPVKLDVTGLMAELLTESPTWYNISSGVAHSLYWGLRDAVASQPGESVELTPDLLEVGAAAESAISASGVILARGAAYYGYDPATQLKAAAERRESIDRLMRPIGAARWVQRGRASRA